MLGVLNFFGSLGNLTFALITIFTVEKYGISASIISVAFWDALMVLITFILSCTRVFDEDPAAGIDAHEKGEALDDAIACLRVEV